MVVFDIAFGWRIIRWGWLYGMVGLEREEGPIQ